MPRINGKNQMRTPYEKQAIVEEYIAYGGQAAICQKYNITSSTLSRWKRRYDSGQSFVSQTGKVPIGRPRKIELSLDKKIKRLELEVEFLKKALDLSNFRK